MNENNAGTFYAKAQCLTWMASEELAVCRTADTEKEIGLVHAAAYKRRARLNELDTIRVRKLAGDPPAIQLVFDRLGLALVVNP